MDPRIAPPCTDDDSTTGPCGPAAKCLQCKKTARILLDQAAVGRWDTVMNALRAWPKLVNYEPEFEEGRKTLVSVATPLYEGGPPKAPPPFAPCSAHARHPAHRSAPAPHPQHPLRARSVHAPRALCRSNPKGPTARTSRRGGRRRCCSRTTCRARPRRRPRAWTPRGRSATGRSGPTTRYSTGRCLAQGREVAAMHARLSVASAQTVRASKHPPWLSVGAGRRGTGSGSGRVAQGRGAAASAAA